MFKYIQRKNLIKGINLKRVPCFRSFQEIKAVAIFFSMEQLGEIIEIVNQFRQEGKNVTLYTVSSSEKIKQMPAFQKTIFDDFVIVEPKEFSWFGKLNNTVKKQIAKNNYDMTLDLTLNDVSSQHLFLTNPCDFRVGIYASDYPLYDFCLLKKNSQSLMDVYFEIKKYLNSIRKA